MLVPNNSVCQLEASREWHEQWRFGNGKSGQSPLLPRKKKKVRLFCRYRGKYVYDTVDGRNVEISVSRLRVSHVVQ
jgi:hypothetical protein